eukprot:PhF_6_TR30139/c4_g1_i1/m.44094
MATDVAKKTALLQSNRQKYVNDTKVAIQKQDDAISSLKKENDKLREELGASGTEFDSRRQQQALSLKEEIDMLQRKIDLESVKDRDWGNKIEVLKGSIKDTRGKMGGVNVTKINHQLHDKQMKVLENQLDKALVKFNEAIAHNKKLRETIDSLRHERENFDEIYKKLEKELHEKKKQMADIIEASNKCYEQRDRFVSDLEKVKLEASDDIAQFDNQFQKLDEMADNERQQREAYMQKMASQAAATPNKAVANQKAEEQKKLQKSVPQPAIVQEHNDTIDYQDIVDQLKEATGIPDLDNLLQKFIKAEEQNFSMYNFVNGLNREVENLQEDIDTLKQWLHTEKGDAQTRKALKALEEELASTERTTDMYKEKSNQTKEQLEAMRTLIQDIFGRIGCTVQEEVIGAAEVTERNMLTFLAQIESRAHDLIMSYNVATLNEQNKKNQTRDEEARRRRERREAERQARRDAGERVDDDEDEEGGDAVDANRAKLVMTGPSVAHGSFNIMQQVVKGGLPSAGDGFGNDGNDDGEDDRVLSEEEIRKLIEEKKGGRSRPKPQQVKKR